MAFSPDGKLVASASGDKTVRISQVSDGSLVREIKVRNPDPHPYPGADPNIDDSTVTQPQPQP